MCKPCNSLLFYRNCSSINTFLACRKTAFGSILTRLTGYALILIGFVFQSILATGYGVLIDLLYKPNLASWVVLLRIIFSLYPPFHFSKAFYDVSVRSSKIIDISEGKLVQGPGYSLGCPPFRLILDSVLQIISVSFVSLTAVVYAVISSIIYSLPVPHFVVYSRRGYVLIHSSMGYLLLLLLALVWFGCT